MSTAVYKYADKASVSIKFKVDDENSFSASLPSMKMVSTDGGAAWNDEDGAKSLMAGKIFVIGEALKACLVDTVGFTMSSSASCDITTTA